MSADGWFVANYAFTKRIRLGGAHVSARVTRTPALSILESGCSMSVGWRTCSFPLCSEEVMARKLAVLIGQAAVVLFLPLSVSSAQAGYGTEAQAKAMLNRAVAAMKQDKTKALEMFNKGDGGFRDRDLYVFCANATDGKITAHPSMKGENLQDIVGKKGFPLGKEIMRTATEGKISEVTYWWPRPGSEKALEKHTFYTKVVGQNCGVGYYKE